MPRCEECFSAMWFLYLDESGDLGFDFVNKKPSRFFAVTILALRGQENNKALAKAVQKTLSRKLNQRGHIQTDISKRSCAYRVDSVMWSDDCSYPIYRAIHAWPHEWGSYKFAKRG